MIYSSRSLSRLVNAIIISRYSIRMCLYLSTCYLSSSIYSRSRSISVNLFSYSCLISRYWCSSAVLNWGVSSIFLPPINIWEFMALIFSSSIRFCSCACRNSWLLNSRAVIAAFLSSSALLRSASNYYTFGFIIFSFYYNSCFNFFNSISYFLSKAR